MRIDLERHLFPSAEAEKGELSRYYQTLSELEALRGTVGASAHGLLRTLRLSDRATSQFMRHYTYLYLRHAVDTTDETSERESSQLDAEFGKRTAFLRQEWAQIDDQVLEQLAKQLPALEAYRFAIESARRHRPYMLPVDEEEALSITWPLACEWQYGLYRKLVGRTRFQRVITPDGELDPYRQRTAIGGNLDRSVREAGFKKLYEGYADHRDLYAFALIALVRARNRLAQQHRFEDTPDQVYFASYWSKTQVTALLHEIAELAGVYLRYQRLRADYARSQLGYPEICIWDVASSLSGQDVPRFTLEQARTIIQEALAPFGSEFGRELGLLLDPAQGRMDIMPTCNRLPGGFSKGFPGMPSFLFSGGFEGYYNDVRVLTHEATHAVHRQLMTNAHVLPAYAEGPHFLFESFSILSELLLADYCYQHQTDALARRYFLEQFFDGKGMAMFFIAQDAALEQAIYEGVEEGGIGSADDLDAVTKQISARYSIWPDRHDELKMRWITNSLFYADPIYNINYVYGAVLALKYYELLHRDPQKFAPRYIALLKNGFDAPPDLLIKRFLDLEPDYPVLAQDAARLLDAKVGLLAMEPRSGKSTTTAAG